MNKYLLISFLVLLVVTGCASAPQNTGVTATQIQANMLVECPVDLPEVTGTTGKDLMYSFQDWSDTYHECATRHNSLVKLLNNEASSVSKK